MKRILTSIVTFVAGFILTYSSIASAGNCTVGNDNLKTFGRISCAQAKMIYNSYVSRQPLPSGWECSASTNQCASDDDTMAFVFNSN